MSTGGCVYFVVYLNVSRGRAQRTVKTEGGGNDKRKQRWEMLVFTTFVSRRVSGLRAYSMRSTFHLLSSWALLFSLHRQRRAHRVQKERRRNNNKRNTPEQIEDKVLPLWKNISLYAIAKCHSTHDWFRASVHCLAVATIHLYECGTRKKRFAKKFARIRIKYIWFHNLCWMLEH